MAKCYLLTCDFLNGKEVERIGLVSLDGSTPGKRDVCVLSQWLRPFGPSAFEYSLAAGMLGFLGQIFERVFSRCGRSGLPTSLRLNNAGR